MLTLDKLGLWADEEKRIQDCLDASLEELIAQGSVTRDDEEKQISGKLRPLIMKHSRGLVATFHSEASVFRATTDAEPSGHPDLQFSLRDAKEIQWDYDVECKLVRVKRKGKHTDYCRNYVYKGVVERFLSSTYCANMPLGTMIGYIQEGHIGRLLTEINCRAKDAGVRLIRKREKWKIKGVTRLAHYLNRKRPKDFLLTHLWADFRT